jgi:glycosyltransferase involved in cell wall biosynthesis
LERRFDESAKSRKLWHETRPEYDPFVMRNDIAIYTTSAFSAGAYDRARGRDDGGAERQMMLLARALAERGHRVAHIVYPPREPIELSYPLELIPRGAYAGNRPIIGPLLEILTIWRALRAARARVVIVRTASPVVGITAVYCKLTGSRLIFSSSNVSDFTLERMSGRVGRALYRLGVRLADAVVVQSDEQTALAKESFGSLRRVRRIPSFAESAPASDDRPSGDAFLWFGRLVNYKQPMRYVALAQTVPEAQFIMIPVVTDAGPREVADLRTAADGIPNLELLDPLPHAELAALIESAVAIVNTSVLEGMPNAFLEAWARGIPVLTLQFDPDAVVERERLGISAQGSWDRFVEGARELWEGRSDRDGLARRLVAYVGETHSMDAVGARWSELTREVREKRDGR